MMIFTAETREPFKKRLKTVDASEREDEEMESGDHDMEEKEDDESSLYQHVKEAEKGTTETVDAATEVCTSTSKEKLTGF